MIQATNELILGIDLQEEYTQVTYYHKSVREPLTLSITPQENQPLLPMAVRQDAEGIWHFWNGEPETEENEDKKDRVRISGIYQKMTEGKPVPTGDGEMKMQELLAVYFGLCFRLPGILTQNARMHVMVTVKELTEELNALLNQALAQAGIEPDNIYLQDHLSSFFFYTVNQKKELWYQDVALLEYENQEMVGYVLHIDSSTRPAIARVEKAAVQPVNEEVRAGRSEDEWKKEKDRLFFELLKKVFERRNVSVSYLMGDFYSKSWAQRSIQFLCYKRHAFQGKNLYSKGACYAAMERAGLTAGKGVIFGGRDMVQVNLGMEMRIRGKENYYPLVNAGVNWYEAKHVCELIPRGEKQIRILSTPMTQGETVEHLLRLPGLPERPDRATRLRLAVTFTSPGTCRIQVEDLGFGGLYKSSGLKWSREIDLGGRG